MQNTEASPSPSRGRRLLRGSALAAIVAGAGALYQAIEASRDRRRYPPPGRLVDVGGHGLHLDVKGEDKGGPTVVLDMGGSGASPLFERITRSSPNLRGSSTTTGPGSAGASPARRPATPTPSPASSTPR